MYVYMLRMKQCEWHCRQRNKNNEEDPKNQAHAFILYICIYMCVSVFLNIAPIHIHNNNKHNKIIIRCWLCYDCMYSKRKLLRSTAYGAPTTYSHIHIAHIDLYVMYIYVICILYIYNSNNSEQYTH